MHSLGWSSVGVVRKAIRPEDVGYWALAGCLLVNVVHVALTSSNVDFGPVWEAGRAVIERRPVYELVTHGGDYVHTPGSTLLLLPFGLVSQGLGASMLVLLSMGAFIAGTIIAAVATWASPRALGAVVLAFALSGPLVDELSLANLDALCVLPLGLGLFFMLRDKQVLGGGLIGLALTIKPTIAVLILLPLMLGSIRATVSAVVVVAVLNLVALPVIPESGRFFSSVVPFLLDGATDGYNVSLKAAVERAGAPAAVVGLLRLIAAAVLVAGYVRYRRELRDHPGVLVAFLVLGTVFLSSYFFAAYLVYLALGAGVVDLVRRPVEWVGLAVGAYLLLSPDVLRSGSASVDVVLGFRHVVGAGILLVVLHSVVRSLPEPQVEALHRRRPLQTRPRLLTFTR